MANLSPLRFSRCAEGEESGYRAQLFLCCKLPRMGRTRGGVGSTTLSGSLANLWHAATVGESRKPLVLVGATGFEPVTPSVSVNAGLPLC
jgi:hypothetical protein